ncbi:hypothetical protein SCANM63S_02271 [Streptomyces canarius]
MRSAQRAAWVARASAIRCSTIRWPSAAGWRPFHPRSLVELDYGGLVHVLPAGELEGDHSAADVAAGIEALRRGDGAAAGEAYGRLVDRWRAVRDRRSAN